jgi:hypothetical protein
MKVEWQTIDIEPGRLIRKVDCGVTGFYIMGYTPNKGGPNTYGLTSLSDGMVIPMGDNQVMTDRMNAAGYYMPIELTDGIPLDFAKNMPRSRT